MERRNDTGLPAETGQAADTGQDTNTGKDKDTGEAKYTRNTNNKTKKAYKREAER